MNNKQIKIISIIIFLISITIVCILSVQESHGWVRNEWLTLSLINMAFVTSMSFFFYRSCLVSSRLWFRKYVVSCSVLMLLFLYNVVAIKQMMPDFPKDIPTLASLFLVFICLGTPVLIILYILSLIIRRS